MLHIAANWLEQEKTDIAAAKEAYLAENCPPSDLSGDLAALTVRTKLCHMLTLSYDHKKTSGRFPHCSGAGCKKLSLGHQREVKHLCYELVKSYIPLHVRD